MIALVFVAMFSMAMLDNVRGVFVPSFKTAFHIQNTMIGWMLLASSLAYMAGSYIGGYAIKRFNQKKVLLAGAGIVMCGIITLVLTSHVIWFFTGMVLMNIGIALVGLSINTTIPTLKVKNHAVLMNSVHFLYGLGATFTQKSAGYLLTVGWQFKSIYLAILLFFALLMVITALTHLPEEDVSKKVSVKFSKGQKSVIWILSIGLGLYIAAEIQTANWLVNYAINTFKINENAAANYTAAFFMIFSLGRLVGGFAADKIGYLKSVVISVSIASVIYTAGLLAGLNGMWLIAVSGIFFSITYPTVILAIKDYFKDSVTQAAGLIITLSSGVNMLIGLFIGYIADLFGIHLAMFSIPLSLVLCAVLIGYVWWRGHEMIEKY